jgi:putative transposase
MLKSYRYRLFPSKSQVRILERQLELCRQVYNDALAYRKNAREDGYRQVSRFEAQNRLPQIKADHLEFKEVHSLTLQNVVLRMELAFKAFFRRVKAVENPGYPGFKGKGDTTV